ncbi:MAG: hypothetical protein JSR59_17000 [Proteobacteria bacterium]|nr:hypothetical protein [Pseudomonadota bacterium]
MDDGGVVLHLDRTQRIPQVRGRIALAHARCDPLSEDLATGILQTVRRLDGTPCLNAAQAGQQFGRFDLANGPTSQPRKGVLFKADARSLGMPCAHLRLMDGVEPLACAGGSPAQMALSVRSPAMRWRGMQELFWERLDIIEFL